MNLRNTESRSRLAAVITGQSHVEAVSAAEWAQLALLAVQQGLGPVLYWALDQAGVQAGTPEWLLLERSARQASAHYAVLAAEQARLDGALAQAGIPAIWL